MVRKGMQIRLVMVCKLVPDVCISEHPSKQANKLPNLIVRILIEFIRPKIYAMCPAATISSI